MSNHPSRSRPKRYGPWRNHASGRKAKLGQVWHPMAARQTRRGGDRLAVLRSLFRR